MTDRELVVRKLTELKAAYTAADYEIPAMLIEDLLGIMEGWGAKKPVIAAVADQVFAENELHAETLTEVCAAIRAMLDSPGAVDSASLDLTVMHIVGLFLALGWRLGV